MIFQNYFYNDTNLKIPSKSSSTTTATNRSALTLKNSSFIHKFFKSASDHFLTFIQIILLFVLGLTLLLMDLVNASVNHLVSVVPVGVVQSPRGIDDMMARENVPAEITLGAISSWLFVV